MAISLNIGLHDQSTKKIPVELSEEIIPLADLLANPDLARSRLISRHMMSVQEYVNILRTNIPQLLNSASDRSATLESFIDQLQYRYKTTAQNTTILRSQIRQLDATVSQAQTQVNTIKEEMQKAYAKMDTERVEELISVYLKAKQDTVYAQTYSLFLKRSLNQYIALNDYNKVLLDTLINNKEALIKNATVVLPDSGTGLLKKLNLLRTESEHKAVEN
jgi:flagellar biosynthesis chaperone FliJ